MVAALFFGAALCASGSEIEGSLQLGNFGFAPTRAITDDSFNGTDAFWGGALTWRQDISSSIQVETALRRDLIMGNSISAVLQYKSDYFRVAMGPYLGLLNSSSNILKAGISTLLGAEIPGVAFLRLQTESSLGGQASTSGDYFAQSNGIVLGFYVRDSAICGLGLTYKQFAWMQGETELIDSLLEYSFNAQVYEKNVPYRLNFNAAWQTLLRQAVGGPSQGLSIIILGAGIDIVISPAFALLLDFRTSIYAVGSGVLSGISAVGFSPFIFQASAGFRVTLADADAR